MEPLSGVDRVTDYWMDEAESGIPWSFEYQVLAQEGDLFVVRAVTTYPEGTQGAEAPEVFHNLWLVTLEDGRASEFVEYLHARALSRPRARRAPGRVDSAPSLAGASGWSSHGGAGDGPRG